MFVYGPVPSRRLGRSLGVSPIPAKTCSYNCVYCQLGRTGHRQTTRASFYPREDILREIVAARQTDAVDYITFVGDGEPTLCRDLGWLIRQTKAALNLPVAVITNGSLLAREDVRSDLAAADVVMPSLDAGTEPTFRVINRPHDDIAFETMVEGQLKFRQEYAGQIWMEVMLVHGVNDDDRNLRRIQQSLAPLKPDRVYIMSPIRPPAESWVLPPPATTIINAQHIIGGAIPLPHRESGEFATEHFADARQAILEIGSRHPLRHTQSLEIEMAFNVPGTVEQMLAGKELIVVQYRNEQYLLSRHFVRAVEVVPTAGTG